MKRFVNLWIGTSLLLCSALTGAGSVAAPNEFQLLPETVALRPSKLPGFEVATRKCAICHSADYIAYQPPGMSRAQWTAEMTKMQHTYGAPLTDAEISLLGIYLAASYGDASSVSAADLASQVSAAPASPANADAVDVQALLNQNACLSCHALNQKIVGPAYHDVAARYAADPQAVSKLEASIREGGSGRWGPAPMPAFATLSPAQLKALAEFVLKQ